jgi:hypothetical protein
MSKQEPTLEELGYGSPRDSLRGTSSVDRNRVAREKAKRLMSMEPTERSAQITKMSWEQLDAFRKYVNENFHSIPGAKQLWAAIRNAERQFTGTKRGSYSSRGAANWAYLQRRQQEDAAKRPDRRHQQWGPNPTYGEWRAGG